MLLVCPFLVDLAQNADKRGQGTNIYLVSLQYINLGTYLCRQAVCKSFLLTTAKIDWRIKSYL